MLSVQQVASATGLSQSAVYRAIECGELRASKLRGRLRVEPHDLAEWKERCTVEPRGAAYEPAPKRSRQAPPQGRFASELRAIKGAA